MTPRKPDRPTDLSLRPLSKDDRDDRIRAVFGLRSEDPLPKVNEDNLRIYHRYLATRLSFPFEARFVVETGPSQQAIILATVMALTDPEQWDAEEGIVCEAMEQGKPAQMLLAELEVMGSLDNRQLVEDYSWWFHHCKVVGAQIMLNSEWLSLVSAPPQPSKGTVFRLMLHCGVWGAILGTSVGALLAAMEVVQLGALVGAGLLGFVGYGLGTWYGKLIGAVNRWKLGSLYGGILGALGGVLLGSMLGAMLGGLVGIVIGGLIGAWVSGWFVRAQKRVLGVALGAALGATAQAFFFDQDRALEGAVYGAVIGALAGVLLVPAILKLIALCWPSQRDFWRR